MLSRIAKKNKNAIGAKQESKQVQYKLYKAIRGH
jgi:hypothetical protein